MSAYSSPLTHAMARDLARQLRREDAARARAARTATARTATARTATVRDRQAIDREARVAAVAAVRPAPLRLTRRGRLTVFLAALTLALLAAVALGATSAATDEPGSPASTRVVMIGSGDTLWGVAEAVAEPGETQAMVLRIMELNGLDDASVAPGQQVRVPTAG